MDKTKEILEFIQNAPTAWWVVRSGSDAAKLICDNNIPMPQPGLVLFSEYPQEDVSRQKMSANDWRAWLVEELKKRYL